MAFAASDAELNMHIIFLGEPFAGATAIQGLLSTNSPALLVKNDYALVTGDKLLQTFDYLEVTEFSTKSLILAVQPGTIVPMNDQQVEELRQAFLK